MAAYLYERKHLESRNGSYLYARLNTRNAGMAANIYERLNIRNVSMAAIFIKAKKSPDVSMTANLYKRLNTRKRSINSDLKCALGSASCLPDRKRKGKRGRGKVINNSIRL